MSCHGETHDAETEKSDFSHVSNLGVLPALDAPDRVLESEGEAGSFWNRPPWEEEGAQ
jgi:hypothetical protein